MKNAFLYGILWVLGIIVACIITAMSQFGNSKNELFHLESELPVWDESKADYRIVNDLLLSANELNISGNSGLIDLNKKDTGFLITEEIKINPGQAYNRILKSRLAHIRKKRNTEDFYVKPVPK